MQIGIALMPSAEVTEFVIEKERYLSGKYNTFGGLTQPPHVTVKWPFDIPDPDIILYEKYCEDLASRIEPFEVKYNGYGFFEPQVIFIVVVSSKEIVELHLKILKELKEKFGIDKSIYEGANQQFHTTLVMNDITPDNFSRAKKELLSCEQPKLSFVVHSIGLFRFTGKEWVVHKAYKLLKK